MTSAAGSRRIEAALFDLDGTLVDSLADIAASMNHVLAELGHAQHDEITLQGFIGEGARHLVARSLPAGASEAAIDDALARYKARYRTHSLVNTRPFDGILAMLDALAARGIQLGVVTNKPHRAAEHMTAELFGEGRFGVVLGESPGRKKPDPQIALDAASELGVAPEACAFIGDTHIDIETAHAAGMRSIGVSWGLRPRSELEGAGAMDIVDRVEQLTALLAR
jgi:phosphoglycolate phosphatase